MFYTKLNETTDFRTALSWHQQGEVVLIDGWVKATRIGKEKDLPKEPFSEIIKLYPKWKITTENKKVDRGPKPGSFYRYNQWSIDREKKRVEAAKKLQTIEMKEVREAAKTMVLPRKKRKKLIKKGLLPKNTRKERLFSEETRLEKLTWIENNFSRLQKKWEEEGKDTKIVTLYHGTSLTNINSIFAEGFRTPYSSGMLGRGVYFGRRNKARNYSDGLVLVCEVMLGKCKELKEVEKMNDNLKYDSMHMPKGQYGKVYKGFLRNEEWVVKDPAQIRIIGVLVKGL